MIRKIDISHRTVFFITGFLAALWALYQIKDVIILLFIAIIFMSALSPIVDHLTRFKIPKTLAIGLTYLVIILVITALLFPVITPLVNQTTTLIQFLPTSLQKLFPDSGPIDQSLIQNQFSDLSKNAFSFTLVIFSNFIALISLAVLTFYLLLERARLDKLIGQLFYGHEERAQKIVEKIEDKLGAWMRGQLTLSLIIGLLVYVALFALGVPYALPLAIFAGIMEIVPVIGPIISAVPAILVALTTLGQVPAIITGVIYFVIQQLENSFIVPQVMKKAVGLNPLIVILAVSIGGKLLGIPGALLAIPITVVIQIFMEEVFKENRRLDLRDEVNS